MTHALQGGCHGGGGVDFSLCLITDRCQTGGRPLASVVREALEGGVRAVQLREKDLRSRELFELASELRLITREYGARLLINDRADIALAVDADGIHIGAGSVPVPVARQLLGRQRLIGYSAHSLDEALRAEEEGADLVTFGPVYYTPSKALLGEPVGIDMLAEIVRGLTIPVFALGGVKEENIAEVMAVKTSGIAVISAIVAASDPRGASASLLHKIRQHAINP